MGVKDRLEVGVVGLDRGAVELAPHVGAALVPGGVRVWLLVLDGVGGEEVLALGDACPDDLGGEFAFAVVEDGAERSSCRGELAGDVLPGAGVDGPGTEGYAAVQVVDEVAGVVELPGECVHGDPELREAGSRGLRGSRDGED